MKKQVGIFIVLLFLSAACGTPAVTETLTQSPHPEAPSPTIIPTPSLRPTSTLDANNQEAVNRGERVFCQVGPDSVWLGATVNVSVFGMPPNDEVSIYVFPHKESAATLVTDSNGYVNGEITIPMDANMEANLVIVNGTDATIECFVWVWSEEYMPTYYAGLTKTLTPTLSSEQVVMTTTQQALNDTLGANCTYGSAQAIRLSPNGVWAEAICGYDSIIIVRMDKKKEWNLSSESLMGPYTEHFVHVSHWSNDGAYVYIDVDPHTDGYWEPFHQGMVLFRLNLESGEISEVLPQGKSDWIFYSFAFSPNDRRLAYIMTDRSPVTLHIRDMQTGIEQSFQFDSKYNTGGGFVWSPGGQKLVFSITQYDINAEEYLATSIVLWEIDKPETTTLIEDHQSRMQVIEWKTQTKITLQAEILQSEQVTTQKYELNLTTNELTELNP